MLQISKKERSARRKDKEKRRVLLQKTIVTKKTEIDEKTEKIMNWINEHYVTTRRKRVDQYKNKDGEVKYVTYGGSDGNNKVYMHDSALKDHLSMEKTIGVFAAEIGTKFVTFDVDYEDDLDKAEDTTLSIINILKGEFELKDDEILVSFSGSKGYHVEVFFNKMVSHRKIDRFYKLIIRMLDVSTIDVELRPTKGQAVKLPLSVNMKTNNKCYIADHNLLTEIADESILNINKIDFDRLEENFDELEELFPVIKDSPSRENRQTNELKLDDNVEIESIETVLDAGMLVESGSRHNVTLGIAALYNTEGRTEEDALDVIWSILTYTFNKHRTMIGSSWNLSSLRKETERVVGVCYKSDLKIGAEKRNVYISKEDILYVLQAKKQVEREILLAMLVHSRKYANNDGVFYLTNNQMVKYGITSNRSRTKAYRERLEQQGLIETVKQNEYTGRKMITDSGTELAIKDPNKYKVLGAPDQNEAGTLINKVNVKFLDKIVTDFLNEDEARKNYSKEQFYTRIKKYYE